MFGGCEDLDGEEQASAQPWQDWLQVLGPTESSVFHLYFWMSLHYLELVCNLGILIIFLWR